jgi:hypothetical protein
MLTTTRQSGYRAPLVLVLLLLCLFFFVPEMEDIRADPVRRSNARPRMCDNPNERWAVSV